MDCPGGWSRHKHDRCTLEDEALLPALLLGTAIAKPQHNGPSHAAFSVTFQAINAQQRNPPRKSRLQAIGAFSLSLSALGKKVWSKPAQSQGPLLCAVSFETAQGSITCPHNLSSSRLNETISCFLKSWPCLFISPALPALGPCEGYPSIWAVPRDPIYPI